MHKMKLLIGLSMVAVALMGCAGTRTASALPTTGSVYRLSTRPDFETARTASPEWVRDALHTVNGLESEVKELKEERTDK